MNITCRLYGHTWHHPNTREVVVDGDGRTRLNFECPTCNASQVRIREDDGWRPDEVDADGPLFPR